MTSYDCIVIGSGHAGSCAAFSAVESGCKKVLIVDKCPAEWVGGNGYFTAGAHRIVHDGLSDLLPLVNNVTPELAAQIDVDPYTRDEFVSDIMRLGNGQSDSALVDAVVDHSLETVGWLAQEIGIPFTLAFNRQAYKVNGRHKFWGGLALSVEDGGKGLIAAHQKALTSANVEIWFNTPAVELLVEDDAVVGVTVEKDGQRILLRASGVVLAAGGFEASAELRTKYLGEGWERARVRGTPYNTGDGIRLAQAIGAKLSGDWQGCHSTAWDANAPANAGERGLTNQFTKSGYPLGIMLNKRGERFVDEGEDFRNYTYAKFGRAILMQPEGCAFQIWDAKGVGRLRVEEYGDGVVEKITGRDIEELAAKLIDKGLEDTNKCVETLQSYNEAVQKHREENPGLQWDPAVKDGLSTQSKAMKLELAKSNWALTINEPPLVAVKVACGVTFTFGGLAIDSNSAGVISEKTGQPIPGLFCTGEMVGGIFYGNYPGGSGLTAGAVFGRKSGQSVARLVKLTNVVIES